MFFKRQKEAIYNWAHGVEISDEINLKILNTILEYITNITNVWKNDRSYQDIEKELTTFTSGLYSYKNINEFLKYYNTPNYYKQISLFLSQGLELGKAKEATAKSFANYSGIIFQNNNEFKLFYQALENLDRLQLLKKQIQTDIISKHYIIIFGNCKMANLIRIKNGTSRNIIGAPENIELILGNDGELLRDRNEKAIAYVINLEKVEEDLEVKKQNIEYNQAKRKF